MDFQQLRKQYADRGIEVEQLDSCPFSQLEKWLTEASATSPGPWFEANAMALATAGSDGSVSVRYVLLKGMDQRGIRFFTNYDSLKGQQLATNPNCSVVLHWPHLGRQVRISGAVVKTSREDSEKYFHSRPRGAQMGAAISNQSQVVESRQELASQMQSLETKLQGAEVPLPDNWGGYQVNPVEFEFWQGRNNRLHDRIVYRFESEEWQKLRLSP